MNHKMQALVALGFTGLFMAGIGAATLAVNGYKESRAEEPAREARLIGMCDGRLMAALEESAFPAGCEWIEPIRFEPEAMTAGEDWKELESAAILKRGLVNPMTGKAAQ